VELDGLAKDIGQEFVAVKKELRAEIKQKVETKPRVIIYDPSEALKAQITEFSKELRQELNEIRKELGMKRKGEVIDLPALPRRRA
jgi:ribosomal protein L10